MATNRRESLLLLPCSGKGRACRPTKMALPYQTRSAGLALNCTRPDTARVASAPACQRHVFVTVASAQRAHLPLRHPRNTCLRWFVHDVDQLNLVVGHACGSQGTILGMVARRPPTTSATAAPASKNTPTTRAPRPSPVLQRWWRRAPRTTSATRLSSRAAPTFNKRRTPRTYLVVARPLGSAGVSPSPPPLPPASRARLSASHWLVVFLALWSARPAHVHHGCLPCARVLVCNRGGCAIVRHRYDYDTSSSEEEI